MVESFLQRETFIKIYTDCRNLKYEPINIHNLQFQVMHNSHSCDMTICDSFKSKKYY